MDGRIMQIKYMQYFNIKKRLSQYQSDSNWKNAFKGGIYAIPS